MTTRVLPFRDNGHQALVKDGELTEAWLYESLPGHDDLFPYFPGLGIIPRCGACDRKLDPRVTDTAIEVATPCPYPDGITTVIRLAVPSGKLIVSDSLRPVYDWNDDKDLTASYNSALGQDQAIRTMAKAGCAFGPIGNSCPGLYRTGDGTYVIASAGYDEDTDEELVPEGWKSLAGIITDLWAYSIADLEDWKARGGNLADVRLGWTHEIVDVAPGTYEFTHHTGERSFDRDAPGTVIYAHARLIREGTP